MDTQDSSACGEYISRYVRFTAGNIRIEGEEGAAAENVGFKLVSKPQALPEGEGEGEGGAGSQ